jgi:hypothetical protein
MRNGIGNDPHVQGGHEVDHAIADYPGQRYDVPCTPVCQPVEKVVPNRVVDPSGDDVGCSKDKVAESGNVGSLSCVGMNEIDPLANTWVKQEERPLEFDDLQSAHFSEPFYERGACPSDETLPKPSISEGADQEFCLPSRAPKSFVKVQVANGHDILYID